MKPTLPAFLLAFLLIKPCHARLGEDLPQLRNRYGVETVVTMDGQGNGSAEFRKSGLEITCDLANGKTKLITIRSLDEATPLSATDAAKLVAANQCSKQDPFIVVVTDPATGYTAWQDKAKTRSAVYRPSAKNTTLLIFLDPPEEKTTPPPRRNLDGF